MFDKSHYSLFPVIGSQVSSPIIGSDVDNPDNSETDYPTEKKLESIYKKDILIIEDSPAVSLVIHKFLKNLGYENIHTCTSGKNGMKIFAELTELSMAPIVFLDYSLPDMNGDEVMEKIFEISPDAKIIIESANEKSDEVIKEILRHGAFEFLGKPIRFENIKEIMKVLAKEESIIEDRPDYSFDRI